jgi:hypothetical protein
MDTFDLARPADAERAAVAIARGAIVGHAFGNFYVITTRTDAGGWPEISPGRRGPPDEDCHD